MRKAKSKGAVIIKKRLKKKCTKIDYDYILELYNYHLSCLKERYEGECEKGPNCNNNGQDCFQVFYCAAYEEGCVHAFGHILGFNYTVEEVRKGIKNKCFIYTRPVLDGETSEASEQ